MTVYFAVNINSEYNEIKLHDTPEEAKEYCLKQARKLYERCCDSRYMDDYEESICNAVYGIALGRCESDKSPLEDNIAYIIEEPKVVEFSDGWIKCTDKLPTLRPTGSSNWVLLWGIEEETDNQETMFQGFMVKGGRFYSQSGTCHDVTHWQPLPPPPVQGQKE